MTVGIPDDMRQTAALSLAGHLVVLAMIAVLPFLKVPPKGATSYQVTLVSAPALPSPAVRPAPAPVPAPTPAVRAPDAPAKPVSPAPVATEVRAKAQEPAPDSLKEKLRKIALPQEVAPAMFSEKGIKPSRTIPDTLRDYQRPAVAPDQPLARETWSPPPPKQEPGPSTGQARGDLDEILRKADTALHQSPTVPVVKPAASASSPHSTPKTSEEIDQLLSKLRQPVTVQPGPKPPATPVVTAASPGPSAASRSATLEPCPQKAKSYCPLLQAAINRAWNADTNPGVRQVLESAGNSTATVRIVIRPNGEIRDLSVGLSSGNDSYDRAVLSILRGLKTLPPLPEEMRDEPFIAVTSFTYTKPQDS
jgi:TonB family protein